MVELLGYESRVEIDIKRYCEHMKEFIEAWNAKQPHCRSRIRVEEQKADRRITRGRRHDGINQNRMPSRSPAQAVGGDLLR